MFNVIEDISERPSFLTANEDISECHMFTSIEHTAKSHSL